MNKEEWDAPIIPARLSFLTIYNPSLGRTDETFRDQVLFYYSHAENEARDGMRKSGSKNKHENIIKEEENERLRQIGLAQGMVDFARSFSEGQPVDSVETDKSRIVMHELEKDWWILASIDLTRLPAATSTAANPQFEYSSREVSPPALLLQQILTANRTFLLHHGPSIDDAFVKVGRERFCAILERYWTRFCSGWEVLIHGNPAVDVFGGLKLSSGGELGIGVGEEEWGSGERDVLEDLTRHTQGLVDLTVSRFGEPASTDPSLVRTSAGEGHVQIPWLGCGHVPEAQDGVVFGGIGALTRSSLRDVSAWVQQIYLFGDYAYGAKDNPHRQRRKRRRLNPPRRDSQEEQPEDVGRKGLRKQVQITEAAKTSKDEDVKEQEDGQSALPHDPRPAIHDRVASHDHATGEVNPQIASHPGIPPPIVSAVEQSLSKAVSKAAKPNVQVAKSEPAPQSSYAISDRWMKYLTLGLSTVTLGSEKPEPVRPPASRNASNRSDRTLRPTVSDDSTVTLRTGEREQVDATASRMKVVEPIPDGDEIAARIAEQVEKETEGYFLIGYQGDLNESVEVAPAEELEDEDDGDRILLRTIQVEVAEAAKHEDDEEESVRSAGSSNGSGRVYSSFQRLRILVYVRRPFIYTFLFEQRAEALQISSFYRKLHQHLLPLHKPMLDNTSFVKVSRRLMQARYDQSNAEGNQSPTPDIQKNSPLYDLVFDPRLLTLHTSIPNIPATGTLAAEGFGKSSAEGSSTWTRIEGINVHSQILNTLDSTKAGRGEIERTSKTTRGWWVVWMRIPPYSDQKTAETDGSAGRADGQGSPNERINIGETRTAFLVRKATDWSPPKSVGSRAGSFMFGFGAVKDETGPRGTTWGPAALTNGIGIDARKYVEGLLSLNR